MKAHICQPVKNRRTVLSDPSARAIAEMLAGLASRCSKVWNVFCGPEPRAALRLPWAGIFWAFGPSERGVQNAEFVNLCPFVYIRG